MDRSRIMKATMVTVVLFVLLVLGFTAQAQEIPGGIVYSDGKNAIYYDYKSGETKNLTADLRAPPIRATAASEDGLVLTWLQDNKLLARKLPDGKPYVLETKRFSPVAENVRTLTLSPEGSVISWESTEKEKSWILEEAAKARVKPGDYNPWPKYVTKIEEYNALTALNSDTTWTWRCGNAVSYPPTLPIRTTYEASGIPKDPRVVEGPLLQYVTPPDVCPGISIPVKTASEMFGIKRDAHLIAWRKVSDWKTNQFYALAYRTEKGWTTIEIRNSQFVDYRPGSKDKPGVWEIPISLSDLTCLAWKPDGSLTYLSDGKIFAISADQIQKGIADSKIGIDKRVFSRGTDKSPTTILPAVPVNNVLRVKTEVVAEGINGDRLHWVTDDTFLFRRKDYSQRDICSWKGGKVEIICPAPAEFSYCDRAPFGITGPLAGKDKSELGNGAFKKDYYLSIGGIRIHWDGQTSDYVRIWIGEEDGEYALTPTTKIEDLSDPSKYTYRKAKTDGKPPSVTIKLDQILLLRSGNKYVAIKPVELEHRYKSVDDMEPELKKSWTKGPAPLVKALKESPPPIFKSLTYEWKYWPTSSAIALNKVATTRPASDSFVSGKGQALEKPEGWSREKIPSAFCITVGGVKATWHMTESGRSARISLPPWEEGKLEYAFIQGQDLEVIVNPASYKYKRSSGDYSVMHVYFSKGAIVLIKHNDEYVALRSVDFSTKYKTLGEMPEEIRKYVTPNLDPKSPRASTRCLDYEWKHWPAATVIVAKTAP